MASVSDIRNQFLSGLTDCHSLFTHCRTPLAQHSPAGIESAFLEAFKAWEVFLEELTIAYLTGELDIVGNRPQTNMMTSNPEICRAIINDGRQFISWADPDVVRRRFEIYFAPSTLDAKLNVAITELREIVTCRNAIAHSSGSAFSKLEDLWIRKSGSSRSPLRTADVLLLSYILNPPFTWFDRYLQVLDVLSDDLSNI